MISLQTNVDLSKYAPRAARILGLLGPEAKKELHDAAATEVVELLRRHIRAYAATHHDTADRIAGGPAQRTGHLEKAAEGVEKGEITSDLGVVNIRSPGFRRALGPLTIRPREKPALTVPMHARAYGQTVSDVKASGLDVFRIRTKDGREFLAAHDQVNGVVGKLANLVRRLRGRKASRGALIVLYALKDEVTLKHAPDMLPQADEFRRAALAGVVGVVEMRLGRRGAA